jgi:beta-galactosidase
MNIRPWATPELTAENRLPMHSVPHPDRLVLDGRWHFQLLHAPEEEAGPDWTETDIPGCWTMSGSADPKAGFFDLPHYTNVQMPFPGAPARAPGRQPHRRLRARVRP